MDRKKILRMGLEKLKSKQIDLRRTVQIRNFLKSHVGERKRGKVPQKKSDTHAARREGNQDEHSQKVVKKINSDVGEKKQYVSNGNLRKRLTRSFILKEILNMTSIRRKEDPNIKLFNVNDYIEIFRKREKPIK